MSTEVRYRFGPHPHGGFILGFRLAQLIGFVVAGAVAVMLLSVGGILALLLIALDALLAASILVFSLHGHTLEEWTPLCFRFLVAHLAGRQRFRSAQTGMGHVVALPGGASLEPHHLAAPVSLPCEIAELAPPGPLDRG